MGRWERIEEERWGAGKRGRETGRRRKKARKRWIR